MTDNTKNTVVKIELAYDTTTGAFEAKTNSMNQITTLGMLSMALTALNKPREKADIKIASTVPAGLKTA